MSIIPNHPNRKYMFAMSTNGNVEISPKWDRRDCFEWLRANYICTTSDNFRKMNLGYIIDNKIVLVRGDTEDNSIINLKDILLVLKGLESKLNISVKYYIIETGENSFKIDLGD